MDISRYTQMSSVTFVRGEVSNAKKVDRTDQKQELDILFPLSIINLSFPLLLTMINL